MSLSNPPRGSAARHPEGTVQKWCALYYGAIQFLGSRHTPCAVHGTRSVPTTFLLFLLAAPGWAAVVPAAPVSEEEILGAAVEAFARGQAADREEQARELFRRAADLFTLLRSRGVRNPALFANQGNAELLAGRLGPALMAYQRGLRLAPNDSTLRDHLAFARSRVSYASDVGRLPGSAWPAWLPWPSLDLALTVAAVFFTLTCLLVTRWRMTRQRRWLVCAAVAGAFTLLAGLGAWLLAEHDAWQDREPLVVVAAEAAPFHTGNGTRYPRHPALSVLPAGLEARGLHQRGGWRQIRLATGEIGWVRARDVVADEP